MRLFLAINIPEDVREKIFEIQKRLKSSMADVKWVSPGKFHFTLKFLGETDEEKIPELTSALLESMRGFKAFRVLISGAGAFPGVENPRVVWAGVTEGGETLGNLAGDIENNFERIGFPREDKKFTPHLTLGRVRSKQNIGALSKIITSLAREEAGSFDAGSVDLMQSILHQDGPEYICLKSISI